MNEWGGDGEWLGGEGHEVLVRGESIKASVQVAMVSHGETTVAGGGGSGETGAKRWEAEEGGVGRDVCVYVCVRSVLQSFVLRVNFDVFFFKPVTLASTQPTKLPLNKYFSILYLPLPLLSSA